MELMRSDTPAPVKEAGVELDVEEAILETLVDEMLKDESIEWVAFDFKAKVLTAGCKRHRVYD